MSLHLAFGVEISELLKAPDLLGAAGTTLLFPTRLTKMLIAGLVLFSSGLLNTKPSPVFANVSIGTERLHRFLVDTGSQTSLIDAKLAARLELKPEFLVEIVTQNTTRLLPVLGTFERTRPLLLRQVAGR